MTSEPETFGREQRAPRMIELGGMLIPEAPANPGDLGVALEIVKDLALKMAYTHVDFTTEWAVGQLGLPSHIVVAILADLKKDRQIETLGTSGPFGYRFSITRQGRERAVRLFEISGYVGPAPVSLESYSSTLELQLAALPRVTPEQISAALSDLVFPSRVADVVGLAASAGRSLFLHGPPGNGKTSLGHLIHESLRGEFWIPYCVAVDNDIIRIFDPQSHDQAPLAPSSELAGRVDQRWVRIRRPLIVAAGELTMDALDLSYSRERGCYEAPIHVKANGGTFLLDDFGRQRVEPQRLLNRWVFPLEHGFDYLTLRTGQKITIPFRQMIIVCTNLDPHSVMDAAFLRRIGYRLLLSGPSSDSFAEIFRRHAAKWNATVSDSLVDWLIRRYAREGRPLRGCEPRDLIDRARDFCTFHGRPFELSEEILDLVWMGYFGEQLS